MKIIFQGKVPEPIIYNGTCGYCKTVVECEEAECQIDEDELKCEPTIFFVKCPTKNCPENIVMHKGKHQVYL